MTYFDLKKVVITTENNKLMVIVLTFFISLQPKYKALTNVKIENSPI